MSELEQTPEEKVELSVPKVGAKEAGEAIDVIETLTDKYGMSGPDVQAMFNASVAVYLRERITFGDRPREVCSAAGQCGLGEATDSDPVEC